MPPDWKAISDACPNPLPTDNGELDKLVMTHRPELWMKHQFCHKWRRKKRKLRKSFVNRLNAFRAAGEGQ
jgi:hypothetical protein